MAQPRHEQVRGQSRQTERVDVQQEVKAVETISEEMVLVKLFNEMVRKVDEIYSVALGLESSPELARLLGEVGVVKVTLNEMVTKLKEAEEMRKAEEGLIQQREMEKEDE